MDDIPSGSVDMVCCDLPFGLTKNDWDKPIPFEPLWSQYWRVCKPNAAIVLFSQMPFTADLVCSQRKYFRYEWIYEKTRRANFLNANRMPLRIHENICVFYRKPPTYNPQWGYGRPYVRRRENDHNGSNYDDCDRTPTMCEDGRRYPVDIIRFTNSDKGRIHPTQKPVDLCEYLVNTYTNEGETVLDNCMGSGSTGIAALNTRRNFIGMELNGAYFEAAKQRIGGGRVNTWRKLLDCIRGIV